MSGDRSVQWGLGAQEYIGSADEETLVIPLIETRGAIRDIDAILEIPGMEVEIVGARRDVGEGKTVRSGVPGFIEELGNDAASKSKSS